MNTMAKNQTQIFCVLEEPDDTKAGNPLHLVEITLSNFNGDTLHSRMNVSCALQLSQEILNTVQGIVKRYPISTDETKSLYV